MITWKRGNIFAVNEKELELKIADIYERLDYDSRKSAAVFAVFPPEPHEWIYPEYIMLWPTMSRKIRLIFGDEASRLHELAERIVYLAKKNEKHMIFTLYAENFIDRIENWSGLGIDVEVPTSEEFLQKFVITKTDKEMLKSALRAMQEDIRHAMGTIALINRGYKINLALKGIHTFVSKDGKLAVFLPEGHLVYEGNDVYYVYEGVIVNLREFEWPEYLREHVEK